MAADTKAAGLRAAARRLRQHVKCWRGMLDGSRPWGLLDELKDAARHFEREARKLERAKEVKRGR